MKKAALVMTLTLLAISLASAASQDPRHPLSHINPTDTDFNMSGYQVFNASSFELQDGLNLSDYSVYDQGGVEILRWDDNNGKWDFTNSDIQMVNGNIQMNGNNITEIDTLHFLTGMKINGSISMSGGDIDLDNGSINDVYSIDGGGDAVNFFDAVDFSGNSIKDSQGALTFDTRLYIPNNELDMAGNNIVNPGNVDGVDLDFPGNGLGITDSRYNIIQNAIGNSELNNSQIFTTQGLDVSGGNITNIDTLKFEEGTSIDGNITVNGSINTTGSLDLNDNDLNDVRSVDGGGDPVRFDDSIDLNGNNLIEPNQIQTGGQNIQIRDTTNGQDVARFQEGGNVEIPNGQLDLQSGNVRVRSGGSYQWYATTIQIDKNSDGTGDYGSLAGSVGEVINWRDNGKVRIPNGNIDLKQSGDSGNNVTNVGTIKGRDNLNLAGEGSSQGVILKQGDGTTVLDAGTADQNVDIPNGRLDVRNARLSGDGQQTYLSTTSSGEGVWIQTDGSSTNTLYATANGQIRIPNGNIELQGNSLVDTSASNSVPIGDGSDDSVKVNSGGSGTFTVNTGDNSGGSTQRVQVTANSGNSDVDISNADLDLNNNNITNYFENACASGEAVAKVDDDGGYYCVDIAEEVMDVFVNESGDAMTGDLDMRGNDIYNVSNVGVGTDTPQESLDVDGTASVENAGTRMEVDSSGNVVVTLGS